MGREGPRPGPFCRSYPPFPSFSLPIVATTRSRDKTLPPVLFALTSTSATNTAPSRQKLPVGREEFKGDDHEEDFSCGGDGRACRRGGGGGWRASARGGRRWASR